MSNQVSITIEMPTLDVGYVPDQPRQGFLSRLFQYCRSERRRTDDFQLVSTSGTRNRCLRILSSNINVSRVFFSLVMGCFAIGFMVLSFFSVLHVNQMTKESDDPASCHMELLASILKTVIFVPIVGTSLFFAFFIFKQILEGRIGE